MRTRHLILMLALLCSTVGVRFIFSDLSDKCVLYSFHLLRVMVSAHFIVETPYLASL